MMNTTPKDEGKSRYPKRNILFGGKHWVTFYLRLSVLLKSVAISNYGEWYKHKTEKLVQSDMWEKEHSTDN